MKKLIDIFFELVQIDSPSGNESLVAKYIENFLTPLGFVFQRDDVGNLLAKRQGQGEVMLFCAHMDTVQPGIGVKPKLHKGAITSSGDTILGADNKASLAAILCATQELSQKHAPSLELLFTVKEETGGGVEYLPSEWITSKIGFIFDHAAPLGKIVTASPYITNFTAEFVGKAAHTKNLQDGVSALTPLAEFISKFPKEHYNNVSINFGKVEAGSGANVVPAKAVLVGEVRSFLKAEFYNSLHLLESGAHECAKTYSTQLAWKNTGFCPGFSLNESSKAFLMAKKMMESFGLEPELVVSKGVSDANILTESGLDVVVMSDGVKNPHCLDESISLKDLKTLKEMIVQLISYRI